MSDHTPDWKVRETENDLDCAYEIDGIAAVYRGPQAKKHARLIAAAPDMYEALKAAKLALEHAAEVTGMNFPALRLEIDAALAKAEAK